MIKKSEPEIVNWTAEGIQAFNKLKEILVSSPVIANPDFSHPFIYKQMLQSLGYIGAVFSQVDAKGYDHPVAYFFQ